MYTEDLYYESNKMYKILNTCYSAFAEAQIALRQLITSTKETIADPEKHMGRFTKEDRVRNTVKIWRVGG